MKDQRIPMLRRALDALLESLDATVRVRGSSGAEEIPQLVRDSAARLIERLGMAERLASMPLRGTPLDSKRAEVMSGAVRRLDAAYVAFRQVIERTPSNAEAAMNVLQGEIALVRQGNDEWSAR